MSRRHRHHRPSPRDYALSWALAELMDLPRVPAARPKVMGPAPALDSVDVHRRFFEGQGRSDRRRSSAEDRSQRPTEPPKRLGSLLMG